MLTAFVSAGGKAVIATGTAFEAGEGQAEPGDLAVSPYGLSKSLTNEALRHFARWRDLKFGKFVIAGPFGPLEEGRFGWSLFERQGDAWVGLGEVESGDEAERWVRLTSAPSCGTFTS